MYVTLDGTSLHTMACLLPLYSVASSVTVNTQCTEEHLSTYDGPKWLGALVP